MSAPTILFRTDGTVALEGARGPWAGADVAISTPAAGVTLDSDDATYQLMSPSADINVTLPSAVIASGKDLVIDNSSPTANVLTVLRAAADGGGTLAFVAPGEELHIKSTGTVANNWQIVQRTPGAQNINDATLAGNVVLNATELLTRRNQHLNPAGTDRTVTLPLSDTNPGQEFTIRNSGDTGGVLTIIPNAGDPAGNRFLLPGDSIALVSSPGAGYITGDRNITNNIEVTASALPAVTLVGSQLVTEYHAIGAEEGGAPETVIVRPAILPPPGGQGGRTLFFRNSSATFNSVLEVQNNGGMPLAQLAPGEMTRFVMTDDAAGWEQAGLWRSSTIALQGAMGGNKNLSGGSATYQFLDPGAVSRQVVLPQAENSPDKRFVFKNVADSDNEVLEVVAQGADQGGTIATLFPGDTVEVISTGVAGAAINQGWQMAGTGSNIIGTEPVTALGGGADVDLTDESARFIVVTHNSAAGEGVVRMPAISAFNRGKWFLFRVMVGNALHEDVAIRSTAGDGNVLIEDVEQNVAGSLGVRTIIIINDGGGWVSFGQMTST